MNGLGRPLIIMGLVLVATGLLLSVVPRIPWLGKLPGDIFIKREHFSFYFPLATCIIISAALSLILWLIRR
jgi:thiosulfate reductase cytochrome b subunit